MTIPLRLENLTKRFGDAVAVDQLTLDVPAGSFLTLLGPSGCGKTTTLRMVAGLEQPSAGRILLGERDVTPLPAHQRALGMVFQNYALFPHLSVGENVAYGLRTRRATDREVRAKVGVTLERVGLAGMENRAPHTLSGGQQQRVAVARALALEPQLLLFDEPLSNLDAKLRRSVRGELKALQRDLNVTTLYVTHDQEEALALSDMIAVMNAGHLEQLGRPRDIHRFPATPFVADFIGAVTFLEGEARQANNEVRVSLGGEEWTAHAPRPFEGRAQIAIRPEDVTCGTGPSRARVRSVAFLGEKQEVTLHAPFGEFLAYAPPEATLREGEDIAFQLNWLSAYPARQASP